MCSYRNLFAAILLFTCLAAPAQVKQSELPVELRAEDPHIGALLDKITLALQDGATETAAQLIIEAKQQCTARKLRRDCSLVLSAASSARISAGDFDQAKLQLQEGLETAIDIGDLSLKAAFLDGLATLNSATGDPKRALQLWVEALETAKEAKSLYLQSEIDGNLAKQRFLAGDFQEAEKNLSDALQIDQINGYGLKRLHTVYKAFSVLAKSYQELDAALTMLKDAQEAARKSSDWYADMLATQGIALIYAKKGKVQEGLNELSRVTRRNSSVLARILDLENLGGFYEIAGKPQEALHTWEELHALGITTNNDLIRAEANSHAATQLVQLDRFDDAVSRQKENLEIAVRRHNHIATLQALGALTSLTQKHPQVASVAPFFEQMLNEIRDDQPGPELTMLRFTGLVQLGNEYKRVKEYEKATNAFRNAELLDPDNIPKLGDTPAHQQKLLALLHVQHALALDALQDRYGALLQAYRAFENATNAQEKELYEPIALDINRWLNAEEPYDALKRLLSEKRGWDALRLCESLLFEESWNSKWRSDHPSQVQETPQRFNEALQSVLPLSDAADKLEGNLYDIPPQFSGLRVIVARQIAQLLLFRDHKPRDASKFLGLILASSGPGSDRAKFEATCWMSLANGFQDLGDAAVDWSNKCTKLASGLDEGAQRYAHVIESYARLSSSVVPSQESLAAVRQLIGDKPEFRARVARVLATHNEFQSALAESSAAVELFKSEHRDGEAATEALYCSFLLRQLSPQTATFEYAKAARELFRKASDEDGAAKVSLEESYIYEAHNDRHNALSSALAADNHGIGRPSATNIQATLQSAKLTRQSDQHKSKEFFEKAIKEAQIIGDSSLQAQGLQALADILAEEHNNQEALLAARQAEQLVQADSDGWATYLAASAVGQLYEKLGDLQAALAAYKRAEQAAEKYPLQQGFALNAQARVFEILGDWNSAEKAALQAEKRFKDRNYKAGIVFAIGELMSVYGDRGSDLRDLDKALSAYKKGLEVDGSARNTLDVDLIEVYEQQSNFSGAIEVAREGIKRCGKDLTCSANLQVSLAEAYLGTGDVASAQRELNKAEEPISRDADTYLLGRLLYVSGKAAMAAGNYRQAVQTLQKVCDLITEVGNDSSDSGTGIRANYSYIFDDLLSALTRTASDGNKEAAWVALNYADILSSGSFDLRWRKVFLSHLAAQVPADLRDRERTLSTHISDIKRRLNTGVEKGQSVIELEDALKAAVKERGSLATQLRTIAPRYASIAYPTQLRPEDIALRPNELLLRMHLSPTTLYVWLKKADSPLTVSTYPLQREKVRRLIAQIKSVYDQARPDLLREGTVQQIAKLVLPSAVTDSLRSAKHVIYVPDDCLFLVPLEMLLTDNGRPPTLAVSYFPSVRDFVTSKLSTNSRSWSKTFIAFADPITSDSDARIASLKDINAPTDINAIRQVTTRGISLDRLPATGEEVRSIAELFDAAKQVNEIYLGSEASKRRVFHTDLSSFRYIHFATHGLLPGDAGIEEPALVLSREPMSTDMLLGMGEVLTLRLNADLVVLSACNTGAGKLAKGEGVANLGKAFMVAGSSSVAMSLWQVSDESTALLMRSLYTHLIQGVPKATALMLARKELYDAGYTNAFFWAPFVIMGE